MTSVARHHQQPLRSLKPGPKYATLSRRILNVLMRWPRSSESPNWTRSGGCFSCHRLRAPRVYSVKEVGQAPETGSTIIIHFDLLKLIPPSHASRVQRSPYIYCFGVGFMHYGWGLLQCIEVRCFKDVEYVEWATEPPVWTRGQ